MRFSTLTLLLVWFSAASLLAANTAKNIDGEKSVLTVRVGKSGFFSAFGHDHEISAPIESGTLSTDPASVQLTVDARKMRVVDKDVSDKDRAEVQETMLGPKVLDSQQYPQIRFQSTQVEPAKDGKRTVHGDLTLHGQTHPVAVRLESQGDHYRGTATLKQTDFGITPVTVAGGTVKVKDDVRIEFDIVGK
jgi:polyisoprenoid-binding protein YceI